MSPASFTAEPFQLIHTRKRLEVNDADLSGSSFVNVKLTNATFDDINLSHTTIHNVNLSHVSITDADTTGMTIDGVLVSDLQAAYRATRG
jgi:uncharacterized protein YjbI with pentapeptide repeats